MPIEEAKNGAIKTLNRRAKAHKSRIYWKLSDNLRARRDAMFDQVDPGIERVVEIGSQWGWWACRAAAAFPLAQIYCVDPWSDDNRAKSEWGGGSDNLLTWAKNLGPELVGKRVHPLEGTSSDFAEFFGDETIDLVFLDGDHHEKNVLLDLKLWTPKVKKGGVLIGHDWDGQWGKYVRAAVMKFYGDDYEVLDGAYVTNSKRGVSPCWIHRRR